VIVEKNNENLEEELEFFTGERKVETLFVSEDVCSCGNRKKLKIVNAKNVIKTF